MFLFTTLNLQRFGFLKKFNFPERLGLPDVTVIDNSYSNELFRTRNWRKSLFIAVLISLCSGSLFAQKGYHRSQKIELKKGWNAVYLEVDPEDPDPGQFVKGTPIDIVATLFVRRSTAQFSSDPEANLLREEGWAVWYAETRPDSFLSDLAAVSGGRAYLIHSVSDFILNVEAPSSTWSNVSWKSNSYNFVGFSVKDRAGPTFKQFFDPSKSHRDSSIYRLKDGKWVRVEEKSSESIRSGEAFWIYCKGSSKYGGPLEVSTGSSYQGMVIGTGGGNFTLRNLTDHPVSTSLSQIVPSGKGQPMDFALRVLDGPEDPIRTEPIAFPSGNWEKDLLVLEPEQAITVPFIPRTREMSEPIHRSLFRVDTDLGTVHWIRVTSFRE